MEDLVESTRRLNIVPSYPSINVSELANFVSNQPVKIDISNPKVSGLMNEMTQIIFLWRENPNFRKDLTEATKKAIRSLPKGHNYETNKVLIQNLSTFVMLFVEEKFGPAIEEFRNNQLVMQEQLQIQKDARRRKNIDFVGTRAVTYGVPGAFGAFGITTMWMWEAIIISALGSIDAWSSDPFDSCGRQGNREAESMIYEENFPEVYGSAIDEHLKTHGTWSHWNQEYQLAGGAPFPLDLYKPPQHSYVGGLFDTYVGCPVGKVGSFIGDQGIGGGIASILGQRVGGQAGQAIGGMLGAAIGRDDLVMGGFSLFSFVYVAFLTLLVIVMFTWLSAVTQRDYISFSFFGFKFQSGMGQTQILDNGQPLPPPKRMVTQGRINPQPRHITQSGAKSKSLLSDIQSRPKLKKAGRKKSSSGKPFLASIKEAASKRKPFSPPKKSIRKSNPFLESIRESSNRRKPLKISPRSLRVQQLKQQRYQKAFNPALIDRARALHVEEYDNNDDEFEFGKKRFSKRKRRRKKRRSKAKRRNRRKSRRKSRKKLRRRRSLKRT